jgi:tetratricopeptide (TPR) repeat protein
MSKDNVLSRAKKRHALACVQANRIVEALDLYRKICESDPQDAESWFMAGTLYGRLSRIAEAEVALRKAVNLQPNFAAAHLNLGQALELQGEHAEAEEQYARAVQLQPDLADGHDALGRLCQLRGDPRAAISHHQKAVQLNPSRVSAYLSLAKALQQLGSLDAAADNIGHALRLDVDNAGAYYDLAGVRIGQGRYDDALRNIRQALRLKPDYIEAKAVEAYILEHMRDYQGALGCLAPLLDRYPDKPELALVYARLCHFTRDYDGTIARLESLLSRDDLARERRAQIHFRLGDLYDNRGEFARAFAQFQAANQLKAARFDAKEWEDRITNLMNIFNYQAMLRAPRAGNCSERPIFIVGMPRSGTTLVEQMLSMLPDVAVAGELPDIAILADELRVMLANTCPVDNITQLTREQCDGLAQRYLDKLNGEYPQAIRVTDKLPQNFLHLGIIALLFPMARVIHCVRDPLDTCLSCYFQEFTGDHPYAYDLADLGAYYRQYQRLMIHWGEVLDIPIFEVRYEDLVRNPDKLSRAMVEFCGLKWDARCLEFQEGEHLAATASFQQVRQPIYASSVGRWRHYADYLEPLQRALAGQ